ncbi:MAG: hypothetical protein R3F55_12925 [Alphaproteobacteria bacterium]
MAIYLDEDQYGNDNACVGFRHLVSCMGLVVMTTNDLYGAHLAGTGKPADNLVGEVASLMKNNGATAIKAIYGCCDRKTRYGKSGPDGEWKKEMKTIAAALGYKGKIFGFDTSVIDPGNGTYVEYIPNYTKGQCSVYYKRDEKMNFTTGTANGSSFRYDQFHQQSKPFGQYPATTGASIKATDSNKGKLHEVDYFLRMTEFTV